MTDPNPFERHKAARTMEILEVRKRLGLELIDQWTHAREDDRRRYDDNASDVRSELEGLALASGLIALRTEVENIDLQLAYWRDRIRDIDQEVGRKPSA